MNAKSLGGAIAASALGKYELILFALLTAQSAAFVILLTRAQVVSVFALLIGLAVVAAYGYLGYQVFFQDSRKTLLAFRKLSEFIPIFCFAFYLFVSAFVLKNDDSLTAPVILFFTILATSVVLVILFSRSMNALQDVAERGKKSLLFTVYEWVEAFIFAAFWVVLVNVFLFQLYEIPSESMVPTFLEHERVMVTKLTNGPKFPLSDVGLPPMKKLERGDIAVLRNPRYERTRESEVKSTLSQLLYMLTLSAVNIDKYDEHGRIKADPLVKRIIGLPGEKLMMVNDVLYVKRQGDSGFSVLKEDEKYRVTDLNSLPSDIRKKVVTIMVSPDAKAALGRVDAAIGTLDEAAAADELSSIYREIAAAVNSGASTASGGEFPVEQFVRQYENVGTTAASLAGGRISLDSFRDFLLAWRENPIRENLYNENARKLDLLIKLNYSRILRNLVKAQTDASYLENSQETMQKLQEEANDLATYLSFYDSRNMPEFPAAENEYIAKNHYFLMGDNRYNSLDLRHSLEYHTKKIDEFDPYSVLFFTRLAPQAVDRSTIIGNVLFRYWPPSRLKAF